MTPERARILAINGGSSSIKATLFVAAGGLRAIEQAAIERIGRPGAVLRTRSEGETQDVSRPVTAPDQAAAVGVLMEWIAARGGRDAFAAVGHRIVHGGPRFHAAQTIGAAMLTELRRLRPLDPDHLPQEIMLIEAMRRRFPDLPQVACFDTAFHHELPRVAQMLPIPRRYEALGVRRYGFHGLSYTFLMRALAEVAGADAAQGRVVLAHLGHGASLAAVRGAHPVDTSMGFTPAAGLPMGTRSGDLDPGLQWYLERTEGLDAERFHTMIERESGLLGVSETSSDMRELLAREAHDVRAAEAIALFCYRTKTGIGAFAAALGGIDTLVFAGGIGENAPSVRTRICDGLGFLGVELDEARNGANEEVISTRSGRVAVRVIRTDEACMIAEMVCEVLGLDLDRAGTKP